MSNELLKVTCSKIDDMSKKIEELTASNTRMEVELNELRTMMDVILNMDKQIVSDTQSDVKPKKSNRNVIYKNLFVSDTYSSNYMNNISNESSDDKYMGILWKEEWIDEFSTKADVMSKSKEEDKKKKIADYMWKTYINVELKKKSGDLYNKITELLAE